MPSTTTHIRLLVLLALTLACWTGTPDLRSATCVMTTRALGPILLTKFSLPRCLRRFHALYTLVSCVALAATNDLFYYNTFGRVLDLFFERDMRYDPHTSGSGFNDWFAGLSRSLVRVLLLEFFYSQMFFSGNRSGLLS